MADELLPVGLQGNKKRLKEIAAGEVAEVVYLAGGEITGGATETTLSAINGKLPSALVSGRLDVNVGASLPAGTNLIGKFGIDQTAPGTTDSVSVKGSGHVATVTITRPADTTQYTGGDTLGDTSGTAIFELTNIAGTPGGHVMLTSIDYARFTATTPSGMTTVTAEFYNAVPDAIADNAAWDISSSGDRVKYLGWVTLATLTDKGSTLWSMNDQLNKQFKCAAGSTSLWVILRTDTGFTPTASSVSQLRVYTMDV